MATKVSGDLSQGYKVRVARVAKPLATSSDAVQKDQILTIHPDKLSGKDFSNLNTVYFNNTRKGFVLDIVRLK